MLSSNSYIFCEYVSYLRTTGGLCSLLFRHVWGLLETQISVRSINIPASLQLSLTSWILVRVGYVRLWIVDVIHKFLLVIELSYHLTCSEFIQILNFLLHHFPSNRRTILHDLLHQDGDFFLLCLQVTARIRLNTRFV